MMGKIYSGVLLLFVSINSFAATVIYTDKALWAADVAGQIITEDFNDAVLVPGLSWAPSVQGGISSNSFLGVANSSDIALDFGRDITAFGGNWNTGFFGDGGGLDVIVAGNTVGTVIGSHDFFGIISDTVFSSAAFSRVGSINETFLLDDLVFAVSVPVPATLWLFGFGLVVLTVNVKRKQKHALNSAYI